jgi:hypothetical protein
MKTLDWSVETLSHEMQFDWALHSFIKKQSTERKHKKELCHLVCTFSAHTNLKNYGSSFSSFPIQYHGGFARRIHKLYVKICIVSYHRACRRGLRESTCILGTEQFLIISEILLLCAEKMRTR